MKLELVFKVRFDLKVCIHCFSEINPMGKVPAIVDGRLKLFERFPLTQSCFLCIETPLFMNNLNRLSVSSSRSHAILIYLSSAYASVVDHW